jgi:hypothetical protein
MKRNYHISISVSPLYLNQRFQVAFWKRQNNWTPFWFLFDSKPGFFCNNLVDCISSFDWFKSKFFKVDLDFQLDQLSVMLVNVELTF